MANFLNFQSPITTGAPMSTIIDKSRVKAEPVESVWKGTSSFVPPTTGQLWPLAQPTQ
jgi:hypothetical protein